MCVTRLHVWFTVWSLEKEALVQRKWWQFCSSGRENKVKQDKILKPALLPGPVYCTATPLFVSEFECFVSMCEF